jgi:dTMP kinase
VAEGGRGRLIALEGIDGCGKSTQARLLADRLDAVLTFEPGSTPLGASLRTLLLGQGEIPISDRAEALLMAADRAQHVSEIISPTLVTGRWVVTDRFSASTLAYQGYGRDLDRSTLDELVAWATGGIAPDVTVLVDVPPDLAAARRVGSDQDRFESQGLAFQERVAAGYRRLADEDAERWLVVDGAGPVDDVAARVWAGVEGRTSRWIDQ